MKRNLAAGLLMCRVSNGLLEYFLVHPGGPYFKNKDAGVWSIPKGIPEEGEDLIHTAQREFFEETGIKTTPPFYEIGMIKQKGGKGVHAWTFTGKWDPDTGIICNNFSLEWPPRSGKMVDFPEVDKAMWMDYAKATALIIPEQIPFLDRATTILNATTK
ncbi:MAG: NUDIX domain-containing protein [Cyclobacteriaceae bacterium]